MRKEKQLLLDDVKDQLSSAETFLVTQYSRLTANAANEFRGAIEQKGGGFEVVKKRVLMKAAEEAGVTLSEELAGHVAIVFPGEDSIETTKFVFDFSKDNNGALAVLCGQMDGQFFTGEQVKKISKLPGKDQMRAELLSVLEAPLSQTLSTMQSLLTSVIYCLQNYGDSKE